MASFHANSPIYKDPAKMPPSAKSFFDDPERPSSFHHINEWNNIRDFLYTFGLPYRKTVEIRERVVQFPDKRALSFAIATKMNLMQEDYATRLSAVGLQGRLIVEAFCLLLYHEVSYPKGSMVGAQLQRLSTTRPDLKGVIKSCERVNSLCIGEAHLCVASFANGEKAEVVDHVFSIVTFVRDHLFQNYRSEASNAEADSSQLTTLNASSRAAAPSWGLQDENVFVYPTEVHIWLQEIGFEQSFARKLAGIHGFTDMETMQVGT